MENEDDLRRPLAKHPYRPVATQLLVPHKALAATLMLLQRAGQQESGLFWYGPRDANGNGRVAYVVAPRQHMSWGNYSVSPQALAEIVHRLPDGWKPLAQVHSHPSEGVEHSNYDDRMIASKKSLSLVFPFYGNSRKSFPVGIGIHEWQEDYWYLLDDRNAARRVLLCEGDITVEDLR